MKSTFFGFFILLPLLVACDSAPSISQLCTENPKICEEFHEDSWCKSERVAVGKANIENKLDPKDIHKFNQLIAYENYEKCLTLASKIEHKKAKDKKTRRIENLMKARGRLEELAEETVHLEHPRLLYYHWTRFLNKESLAKFIALEGTEALETPDSQFDLATYYTKTDVNKTLEVLFHALELYPAGSELNSEIFKSLSSIFAMKGKMKQAYIWLRVLQLYDPEDPDINPKTLQSFVDIQQLDSVFLDKVADSTLNKIKSGTFVPPKF